MNILIVQRHYMHYRKQLLNYIGETTGFQITVVDTNNSKNEYNKGHISLKSYIKKIHLFGKKSEFNLSWTLIKFIRENCKNYDLIILEGASNILNNIFICRMIKSQKVPYICWDAGRRLNARMTLIRALLQPFIKSTLKNASACIAYSTVAKDYFVSIGINTEKVFICQNTLNVSYLDEQIKNITSEKILELKQSLGFEEKKIILYVGALEERKRIMDLLKALHEIDNEDYALLIVGGGEEREKLELYCKLNNIKNVHFAGEIIEGVIEYFLACDVFILPSEGGLALNQAMICRKPVIASSADGTERDLIINGENGFIFNELDVPSLKECIKNVFETSAKLMGKKSREIIDTKVNELLFLNEFQKVVAYINKNEG